MNKINSVAFDLDGTIYLGNKLINGASEVINYLTKKGYIIFYFTNNSSKNKLQLAEKLEKFGLSVTPDKVYCSLDATPIFLNIKNYKTVFCCGSQELTNALRENSFFVFHENNPEISYDAVVIGMNIKFSYEIIANASLVLQNNPQCKIIACNLDASYPVENGYRMPGCGPIVKAIEVASGRKVDYIVGKPDTFMINLIIQEHRLSKDAICIVGDSEESDIAMAEKANIKSFLLGGNTIKKNAASINSLLDLKDYL